MSLFHIWVLTIRAIDPWYLPDPARGLRRGAPVSAGARLEAEGQEQGPHRGLDLDRRADRPGGVHLHRLRRLDLPGRAWCRPPGTSSFPSCSSVAVWEMARRATGLPLAILTALFILYGHFGSYMPGLFYHKGYHWDRIITFLFSLEGILGLPIQASAHYIFLFVLFGAFVDSSGAGKFFVDFARCIAGRLSGRPGQGVHHVQRPDRHGFRIVGGQRRGGRGFEHPPDEGQRLPGGGRGGHRGHELHRRPDHAAGHGRRRLPDGRDPGPCPTRKSPRPPSSLPSSTFWPPTG